ncbi:MAG TPA: IclR family transcriptional regulator [Burkholderiales bacterium]|jgi:DNA-binding IclR family transcriptional regulator|nr:IclR family transcriptional regulator [Burkholderiales bacterium]
MPTRPSAINSVQKACRILRSLTEPRVSRLSEVATQAGLNKVTTLRILEVLTREGFVRRDEATKTYSLGSEVGILAAAMRDRDDLRSRARPSLVRMAAVTEDSVLLSVRSGSESVCVDREVGSFPIRANYLDIGSRRPLGVGAGAMALLAWQSDAEIEALLPIIEQRLGQYPKVNRKWIEDEIPKARDRGYTLMLNVLVDRMGAVGVPVLGPEGKPIAALAIAALSDRITSRLEMMVEMLRREADNVAGMKRT